ADRSELLKRSLTIQGLYVPEFYSVSYDTEGKISERQCSEGAPHLIRTQHFDDISKSKIATTIVTTETEFSDMYLIEIMRGCPWSCRFCVAGQIYNPMRKKELQSIEDEITIAISKTNRIGLIGPSLSDYPYIKNVLNIPGVDFSITSLRANKKSAELVSLIKGHKSVSIAPEAGTERLRKVIHKRITEEDILETSKLIFAEGAETLRLYFMVGLPTETMEDINGIIDLVKKIKKNTSKGRITVSISTFVPKPFTPFQWHPMEKPSEVKERLRTIKKNLLPIRGINVFHDVLKYAYMQGFFSMGDRRVSKAIEEMQKINDWRKAAEFAGLNKDFYIFRKREFEEILPWDFIDSGNSKEKLWAEYQEAITL
ncbi:MAG: radical SAM protein, partial [Nitrospirota bacterium]|nr:radical SAM protein [Nitrospirota bacterium]